MSRNVIHVLRYGNQSFNLLFVNNNNKTAQYLSTHFQFFTFEDNLTGKNTFFRRLITESN